MLAMTGSFTPPQTHGVKARRFEVEDFARLRFGIRSPPYSTRTPVQLLGFLHTTAGNPASFLIAHDPAATAGESGTDIGNVGRNLLRGPSQSSVDFSLSKRFRIHEARAESL